MPLKVQRAVRHGQALLTTVQRRLFASVWLVLVGFLLILLGILYGGLTLIDRADTTRRTESNLAETSAAVQQEHLFELIALGSQSVPPFVANGISNSRLSFATRMGWLQQHLDVGPFDALAAPLDHYHLLLDEELRLLASSQIDAAQALAGERTTPAFSALEQAITARVASTEAALAVSYTGEEWSVVLALLTVGLLTGVAFRYTLHSRRARDRVITQLAAEQAASALRLRDSLLEQVRSAVVGVDTNYVITYWNPYCAQMYGWTADEALGRSVDELLIPPSHTHIVQEITAGLTSAGHWEGEIPARRKNGSPFPTLLSIAPIVTSDGVVVGATGAAQDLTEQKRTEQALRDSEASFRLLFADNPLPMWVCDEDTLAFLEVNDAAVDHYGYSRAEFLAMRITDIRPEADIPALLGHLRGSHSDFWHSGHWQHRLKDGRLIDVEIASHRVPFGDRKGLLTVVQDITERLQLDEQLKRQAFTDALTGLPNRVLFIDRLRHALTTRDRRARPLAVLFLDLDNFKLVNDSLGHVCGDEFLCLVAQRLQRSLRPGDTLARFGGDEFVVLLDDVTDTEEALAAATRLMDEVHQPLVLADQPLVPSCSTGLVMSLAGTETADTLLRNADFAMYQAKAQGKNQVALFQPAMQTLAINRLELERDLRHALRHGEFELYYQPVVALASGEISEVEALVRWYHPTRGLVAPDQFIPTAEETGLIVPLGYWVLQVACWQAVRWQRQLGKQLVMGVNLSPRQFQDPQLVDQVLSTLAEAGLAPSQLKLEVTEGALMRDIVGSAARLEELHQLGVRIAIDDFGTGYSSLSYLKQLPVDTLKVDKSFVDGLPEDGQDAAIVRAVVALARGCGLTVTAEGVETPAQAAFLQRVGCDRGQGYLFAKPLPPALLEPLLISASTVLRAVS